ncbi:MAG TPA: hypothetical protein PKZ76_14485 [Xanthomonadaceae bacterium]|nr:hypothetical protein [Xanthomonadaceae bacterium]
MNAPVDAIKPSGSLKRQIDEAARHLAASRRSVGVRRVALVQRLHATLISPGMLFFAGASGYLIAEFTHRRGRAAPPIASRPVARSGATNVNLVLSIVLKLVSWLYAATASTPYSGRPSAGSPVPTDP